MNRTFLVGTGKFVTQSVVVRDDQERSGGVLGIR
jgi:hypothetical protein